MSEQEHPDLRRSQESRCRNADRQLCARRSLQVSV